MKWVDRLFLSYNKPAAQLARKLGIRDLENYFCKY